MTIQLHIFDSIIIFVSIHSFTDWTIKIGTIGGLFETSMSHWSVCGLSSHTDVEDDCRFTTTAYENNVFYNGNFQ